MNGAKSQLKTLLPIKDVILQYFKAQIMSAVRRVINVDIPFVPERKFGL